LINKIQRVNDYKSIEHIIRTQSEMNEPNLKCYYKKLNRPSPQDEENAASQPQHKSDPIIEDLENRFFAIRVKQ